MFIRTIRIQNFRAYKDETIELDDYTSFLGANGAGKSTVLCALNIFFREYESAATNLSSLDKEDFHKGDTSKPIEITLTFDGLSEEAKADFSNYFRQGTLVVTAKATFDEGHNAAEVKQYGNRMGMAALAPFFEALGDNAKSEPLKLLFAGLRERFPDIKQERTKDGMAQALRDFEASKPDDCILIPSEDQFYGAAGQGQLRRHLQWVYIPAVKDASGEQAESRNTALGRLLARTVRSQVNFGEKLSELRQTAEKLYQDMLEEEQKALNDLSQALERRLAEWSHPGATAKLKWHQDSRTSIKIEEPAARLIAGDGDFEGSIARFGHGMQRSYIISLLQHLATTDDANNPKLVLGVEEPELYQHPPQARHLAAVLENLSVQNTQVFASTHSPYFVGGKSFEQVRLVQKQKDGQATVRSCSLKDLGADYAKATGAQPAKQDAVMVKLHQVMQPHLSEMFFTRRLVLVEGLEDAAYLNAWMVLTDNWDKFRGAGGHVVAANGKSELIRPTIIAQRLGIPLFLIFDCDGDKIDHKDAERAAALRREHERDNKALMSLMGIDPNEVFPKNPIWGENVAAWPHDLACCVKDDAGKDKWEAAGTKASTAYGSESGLQKNTLHIGGRLTELRNVGVNLKTLDQLCAAVLKFAD